MADTMPPELRQEIATIARDPWQISFGGILRNQDDTLLTRAGGKGLKLYEEIERDPHACGLAKTQDGGDRARMDG